MQVRFYGDGTVSEKARALVDFDCKSILQVVASERGPLPQIWIADPSGYESCGRIQRDSEFSRLLAYSSDRHTVYATDGCNACLHRAPKALETLSNPELQQLSEVAQLPLHLLLELSHTAGLEAQGKRSV